MLPARVGAGQKRSQCWTELSPAPHSTQGGSVQAANGGGRRDSEWTFDNNSARDVAISASARNQTANIMIHALLKVEAESSAFPWYARVPSPSNPSDELSRGDVQFLYCTWHKSCLCS